MVVVVMQGFYYMVCYSEQVLILLPDICPSGLRTLKEIVGAFSGSGNLLKYGIRQVTMGSCSIS